MSERNPTTQTMKTSEAKNEFSRLVNEVHLKRTRILIEKSGIPVAALVSAADLHKLEQLDREWDKNTKAMERFGAAFADVSAEEAESVVARIIAEIRRQDEVDAVRQPA